MDNEIKNIVLQNSNMDSTDISKIKVRKILFERFRRYKPTFKKILPFLIVGFICFAAGVGADRILTKHRFNSTFRDRPSIQRNIRGNRSNDVQGNRGNKSFQGGKVK